MQTTEQEATIRLIASLHDALGVAVQVRGAMQTEWYDRAMGVLMSVSQEERDAGYALFQKNNGLTPPEPPKHDRPRFTPQSRWSHYVYANDRAE